MGAETIDRRRARSRQALLAAFSDLVLERGYAATTVAALTERANVGRSTLYENFGGLPGVLRESLRRPFAGLAEMLEDGRTEEAFVPMVSHFWQNRRYGVALLNGPARPLVVDCLAALLEPKLPATHVIPARLLALQIAEAQLGLLLHWLQARPPADTTAITAALWRTTRALAASLHAPVDGSVASLRLPGPLSPAGGGKAV